MLQVSLLGERTIVDAGTGAVLARSARTLALLAFLAVHTGAPQPRGRIAAAFWPESTEAQALTNLRRELHQLRQVLGGDPSLVVTGSDLAWQDRSSCRVDVRAFRVECEHARAADDDALRLVHGRAALAAYGGDLLPDLYDDWVLAARDELARECTDLADELVTVARRAGDWPTALLAARRRVAVQPLEETGYRTLIRLQVALGDRAGAVSTYHHCASVLEQQLGIQPDASTRALLDAVVPSPPVRRGAVAPPPDFVGREAEFGAAQGALEAALSGQARLVLVRGEPGVGKSRLLAEVTRAAREAGATAVASQCYATTGRLALAPVTEWLQDPAVRPLMEALPPVWQAEVERLLPNPEAGGPPSIQPREHDAAPRGIANAWQRHRFFQGLSRALLAGERPLLLALDNVQWCDIETLDLLSFLAAEQRHGLLVLLAGRTRELAGASAHTHWLRRVRATGALREIDLSPLGAADTALLGGLLRGGPLTTEDAAELHAATGGFPLFVVEAARAGGLAVPQRGPGPAVDSVLQARLAQLAPDAREVAGLAAAVGRDFDLSLLCEASDLPPERVVEALDELWRLRIVDESRTGYDFSHDLLRAAAYDEVSPPRRWLLHRRLAQALELLNAGRTDEVAGLLAEQYARAGRHQRAFEHYRRAADVAGTVFAYGEAIRHDRAALALLPQLPPGRERDRLETDALRSLAASLNALHGYSDAGLATTWERLVPLSEELGETDTLVDSLVGLWATRFVQGQNRLAHHLAARALELSSELPDRPAMETHGHLAYGGSQLHLGNPTGGLQHLEQACDRSSGEVSLIIGSHSAVHARAWSAHAHWMLGDLAAAARCAEDAVARARMLTQPYDLAIALSYGALTWQLLDEKGRLLEAAAELDALSRRFHFAYYPEWGAVLSGWAQGGPDGARRVRGGLARLRSIGAFARMGYWLALLADTLEDDEQAGAVLDAALVTARTQSDGWSLPHVLHRTRDRTLARTLARTLDERPTS